MNHNKSSTIERTVINFWGFNTLVTNGISNPYHLGESNFTARAFKSIFSFYFISDEIHVSKQSSPIWDAAFRGVPSGAILFAYVA